HLDEPECWINLIIIELKKAFDLICHRTLIHKLLTDFNVNAYLERIVANFLSGSPYILKNLESKTDYSFRFSARNSAGISTYGEETYIMAERAAPEKPKIIATPTGDVVHSPYSEKYNLTWTIMPANGVPINKF
ncbi:hypothetical protein QYM36_011065, partial [Artemia franciscana]